MLQKRYKLSRQDIDSLFSGDKKVLRSSLVTYTYTPNNHDYTRFGVSISKKVVKGAVGRILLKRRIFHIIRQVRDSIVPGYDVLLTVQKLAPEQTFQDLRTDMITTLESSPLWSKKS